MPTAEMLTTVVVVAVGIGAWLLALLNLMETWRRQPGRTRERLHPAASRVPTDAEIETRVARMVSAGLLPPGWSSRDAARLLRVHARRGRLV